MQKFRHYSQLNTIPLIKRQVNFTVTITETYPGNRREMISDPLGLAEYIVGTAELRDMVLKEEIERAREGNDDDLT